MRRNRRSTTGHRGNRFGARVRLACPRRRSVWQELKTLVKLRQELG